MASSRAGRPVLTQGPSLPPPGATRFRDGLGIAVLVLAAMALLTPLCRAEVQGRVGVLLVLSALLEIAHGFRRATAAGQRAAWVGGGITMAMGFLLIHAPFLAASALVYFLAGWFGLDGLRYLFVTRRRREQARSAWFLAAVGNLLVAALLLTIRGPTLAW